MKRAEADIICPSFFQLDKATYHLDDIDTGKDLLYGFLWDQDGKFKFKVLGLTFLVGSEIELRAPSSELRTPV